MGAKPGKIEREIRVPSGEREVPIGTVSAGETWSLSAAGEWSTGFVRCGPDGYRNFLYDALNFAPRAPGEARLKLMGRFKDEPDFGGLSDRRGLYENLHPTGRARRLR